MFNIKLVFLPPNTTSKLQPPDAGIIQSVKLRHRKRLLRRLILLMDGVTNREENKMSDVAKKITVLDAIRMLMESYEELDSNTAWKCFEHCGVVAALEA